MKTNQMSLLTQLKQIIWKYRFFILAIFLFFIGAGSMLYAILTPATGILRDIAKDFGVALFTTGVIGLTLEYYTRKQFLELVTETVGDVIGSSDKIINLDMKLNSLSDLISLGNDFRILGVRQIHRERINLLDYLDKAEPGSEIRILGTALMGLSFFPIQQTIQRKIEAGCKVKLLTLNPESEFIRHRGEEENRTYEDIKTHIKNTNEIIYQFINQGLPLQLRKNIEFRVYNASPAFFILSTGSIMVVGFYLRGKRGEKVPHLELEIKEGGIYKPFLEHFDALWQASEIQKTDNG